MKKRSISFSPPDISELEIAEVVEALRSGWNEDWQPISKQAEQISIVSVKRQ